MKLIRNGFFIALTLICTSTNASNEPFHSIGKLPSDCRTESCPLFIGNVKEKIEINSNSKINITSYLEDCTINILNLQATISKDEAKIKATKESIAEIVCGSNITKHKRIAITDYASRPNLTLRKIGDNYSHLGRIQVGLLLLHY